MVVAGADSDPGVEETDSTFFFVLRFGHGEGNYPVPGRVASRGYAFLEGYGLQPDTTLDAFDLLLPPPPPVRGGKGGGGG